MRSRYVMIGDEGEAQRRRRPTGAPDAPREAAGASGSVRTASAMTSALSPASARSMSTIIAER